MLGDGQVGGVAEDLVEDVGRVSDGGGDDLGPVGGVLVGDVGVGGGSLVEEVAGQGPGGGRPAPLGEALPVGGRQGAPAPESGQGEAVVVVDQRGVRRPQRLFPEVPLAGPGESVF
jgi:hypothetical protein